MFGALGAYLLWAARVCSQGKEGVLVSEMDVHVADADSLCLVTVKDIHSWLTQDSLEVYGVPVDVLNTGAIEEALRSRTFVRDARAYTGLDGVLHVEVAQRIPVMRVITRSGCDFYMSPEGIVLPVKGIKPVYVPLVTGDFALPFRNGFSGDVRSLTPFTKKHNVSYVYLRKLINFVGVLSGSPFWDAQVVQIEAVGSGGDAEPGIELVTRVGSHRILFGSIDNERLVVEKLDKLMIFYREVLGRKGWDTCTTVEVGNQGQIVCRRGK